VALQDFFPRSFFPGNIFTYTAQFFSTMTVFLLVLVCYFRASLGSLLGVLLRSFISRLVSFFLAGFRYDFFLPSY